ncbi:superoxide dismutase SOD3 [Besnoitia besnoiti]|uniref:Superoxide dismutase n=1 Tax=Besnoitia besnoiti TaxID=94643 RepID=A0A2A9M569_BESBE|nr:superoxide dismutase SOD3 [Besnoitia besnoiti]PFH33638.1 superoxide dismutase SOD3 [Besnoitia besnoiti]
MMSLFGSGTFELPPLPYGYEALEPHISAKTLQFHHDKHHATYVQTLNKLIKGTEFEKKKLEDIIRTADGSIFNNAGQVWNHTFYWNSMKPNGGGQPSGLVKDELDKAFSSFSNFKSQFNEVAAKHFGSGWVWLVWCNQNKRLELRETHDAGNPITANKWPILTCDVWEHAYYLDTQNDRSSYMKGWWNVVNWDFANKNLQAAMRAEPVEQAMSGGN